MNGETGNSGEQAVSPGQWINEAARLLERKSYDEAFLLIEGSIHRSSLREQAYLAGTGLLQEYGCWKESLRVLEGALAFDEQNRQFWFLKGNALDALYPEIPSARGTEAWKGLEEAERCYDRSLELDQTFLLAWFHRALVQEKLGRHREAMESYRRFMDLKPGPELQPQAQHAGMRIGSGDIVAVPPASENPGAPQTWLGRLADGGPEDAQAFLDMVKGLKGEQGSSGSGKDAPPGTAPASPPPAYIPPPSGKPKSSVLSIPFEVVLLFLSLPVLVPSLIVNFLMAKRWGRIDFVLLAVDGFIILLFSLRSTLATVIVLVALAASALLFIIRYRKLPFGIFLGYSNLVAMLLMGGGLLFIIGFWTFVPWTPLNELTSVMGSEKKVRAEDLINRPTSYNAFVNVQNGTFEYDKKIFRIIGSDSYRFSPFPSAEGIVVTEPMDLWERRGELAGKMVTLEGASLSMDVLEGSEIEFAMSDEGTKEKDYAKRLFAIVPAAKGRVWVVSKPDDLDSSAFLAQQSIRGVLVISFSDAAMGRWYNSRYSNPLPYMGVTLLPERKAAASEEKSLKIETWIPVKGTDQTLWVAFAGDLSAKPPYSMKGIYKGSMGPTAGLEEALKDVAYFKGPLQKPLVIIDVPSKSKYIAEHDLAGNFLRAIKWSALALLVPGAMIILGGLFVSAKE